MDQIKKILAPTDLSELSQVGGSLCPQSSQGYRS